MDIRRGLMRGRIRAVDAGRTQSEKVPSFGDAVAAASIDDLRWAMNLLMRNPDAHRTWYVARQKAIADRIHLLAGK